MNKTEIPKIFDDYGVDITADVYIQASKHNKMYTTMEIKPNQLLPTDHILIYKGEPAYIVRREVTGDSKHAMIVFIKHNETRWSSKYYAFEADTIVIKRKSLSNLLSKL